MDFMIGTIDTKRLRKDLLTRYRTTKNLRSPSTQNDIYAVQIANEQQLMAIAKKEGIELRKYMR